MLDTVITGARIFDGVDTRPIVTDIAIVGDRIALIADLRDRDARERIDAGGLTLCPGFIDVHSHSDEIWLANPRCEGKVLQGVTTEIGGNCGTSVAPLHGDAVARKREEAAAVGIEVAWQGLDTFFSLVNSSGIGLNVATLVGLGTTRRCVAGDRDGRLDEVEAAAQLALVREAGDHGALGVSSGLVYVPSRYANLDELVACAAIAREAGAPRYASHLRDEGDDLLGAVAEALTVGRRAEVAVQCSHHKAAGKRNWGKVHASLAAIDRARSQGYAVAVDAYPYVASWTELATLLPADALAGARDATLARLADPETAAALALRLELDHGTIWHDVLLTTLSDRNADLAGYRIDELAKAWRLSPARTVIRLLLEERLKAEAAFFTMDENDVATVLGADFCCIGSDASARALSGPTARGLPHPRTFGTFPRVFGRFVRGRKTLDLGEAIRHMTSLPAATFGLRDRGSIAVGAYADLVLFDDATIADTATYERPFSYPVGIAGVWVNGTAVARAGRPTGALPGRVLRGNA